MHKNTSPQEAVLPLYLFILSLHGNPPHHTGVGYYTTTLVRTSINLVSVFRVCRVRPRDLSELGRSSFRRSAPRCSVVSMADARRARAERRAALTARVAQTAPVGGPPRRSLSPAANAATGPRSEVVD